MGEMQTLSSRQQAGGGSSASSSTSTSTVAGSSSPAKRGRSPQGDRDWDGLLPPSKTMSSPSQRETSHFFAGSAGAGTGAVTGFATEKVSPSSASSKAGSSMIQQQPGFDSPGRIQSHPAFVPAHQDMSQNAALVSARAPSPAKHLLLHRPPAAATDAAEAAHPFSTTSPHPPNTAPRSYLAPLDTSPPASGHDFKIQSHSGSTTSGVSGSAGSSYDSSLDSAGMSHHGLQTMPSSSVASNASASSAPAGTGLGMLLQGPTYSSSSQLFLQPANAYPTQPHTSSQHGIAQAVVPSYYSSSLNTSSSSPYGFTSMPNVSPQVLPASYASPQAHSYSSPAASYQQHLMHVPHHHQGNLRRSLAGQSSTGGSSYHSNASMSPSTHRRSEDMDTSFIGNISVSSGPSYTPVSDTSSPAVGGSKQQWSSLPQPQRGIRASPALGGNYPSVSAIPAAASGQDVTRGLGYFPSPAASYQSVVDHIMSQSRKGSDEGLDLGDFEMLDTLGTGTFGRVLLVRLALRPNAQGQLTQFPPGMPHYYAMKVLTKSEVVRLKQVEHINCERSILGAVDHPGIVNLFCTFQDSLNIYMLLEFVQGGELFSHLRRAVRFSADVSRFYAANIILVLEYLHNRNLIYRDLKPENLLLDSHGYLKVTDFGFAKYVPDRTFTLCGTPEYLAPEIINSAGHGKAADWWAFGVLLFEMLCGYPPFFDESPWGIYEKILAGNFAFPPHVDPVARDLVRRMLSSDRSKRLGNLRNGAMDVKNHQWFDGVDWGAVERRLIPAPIIPRIKSTSDSQNFERYPTIPIESLPGLAKAKGYPVKEDPDPYEHLFRNF
ncbi:MAG: serine/threonine protein kinase, AGC [Cyphobasidiales sp. Tagirdzhanova-0007]|nr:MAG: serine/threonine protein kinase, AGC [Cyphobasidiales sp. Tagirdzhanova-0007]